MESLARLLRDSPFLAGLTEPQLDFLVGCARNLRFAAGDLLMREGEQAGSLFLVRSGRVALEATIPGRGAVVLETVEPGEILGISWLFPPYRWSLDARAVETVLAFAFDAECLRGKMQAEPTFGYELARRMLVQLSDRITRVRLQRMDLYRTER